MAPDSTRRRGLEGERRLCYARGRVQGGDESVAVCGAAGSSSLAGRKRGQRRRRGGGGWRCDRAEFVREWECSGARVAGMGRDALKQGRSASEVEVDGLGAPARQLHTMTKRAVSAVPKVPAGLCSRCRMA